MFAKKDQAATIPPRNGKSAAPGLSFLGPEVVVTGDVTTTAQLHVEGRIDGNVDCAQLILGEGGAISGDISAADARLSGKVEGKVEAGSVVVEATARLSGDLSYETISVAAGARVEGRLSRRDPPPAALPAPAPGKAEESDQAEVSGTDAALAADASEGLFAADQKKRAVFG